MIHFNVYHVLFWILTSSFASRCKTVSHRETKILTLSNGRVIGTQSNLEDVWRYTLPYAQAPIGSLRWKDPQPVMKWNEV